MRARSVLRLLLLLGLVTGFLLACAASTEDNKTAVGGATGLVWDQGNWNESNWQ